MNWKRGARKPSAEQSGPSGGRGPLGYPCTAKRREIREGPQPFGHQAQAAHGCPMQPLALRLFQIRCGIPMTLEQSWVAFVRWK